MTRIASIRSGLVLVALCAGSACSRVSTNPASPAADGAAAIPDAPASTKNATGLPTYPTVTNEIMDAVYRDLMGHQCIHYTANAPDDLARVEDWYRRGMAGARESDVNENNLYGSMFKLDGIRLTTGTDFANLYRMKDQQDTSIELFKCKD